MAAGGDSFKLFCAECGWLTHRSYRPLSTLSAPVGPIGAIGHIIIHLVPLYELRRFCASFWRQFAARCSRQSFIPPISRWTNFTRPCKRSMLNYYCVTQPHAKPTCSSCLTCPIVSWPWHTRMTMRLWRRPRLWCVVCKLYLLYAAEHDTHSTLKSQNVCLTSSRKRFPLDFANNYVLQIVQKIEYVTKHPHLGRPCC